MIRAAVHTAHTACTAYTAHAEPTAAHTAHTKRPATQTPRTKTHCRSLCVFQIKFQAPTRPGFVPLMVFVKSPVFVGVDCEGTSTFRVYRHDELKEDDDAGDW